MQHKTTQKIRVMLASLLLMFGVCSLQAQQFASTGDASTVLYRASQYEKELLQNFLQELEQEYQVQFAYDGELVNDKQVKVRLVKGQGLENILDKVLDVHELQYQKIGEKLYVIRRKEMKKIQKLNTSPEGNDKSLEKLASINNTQMNISAWQQTISGTVLDGESGEALPGVNVLAKGTTIGTVTGVDGTYRLSVEDGVTTLVFSSIGYVSEDVEINGRSTINLDMMPDIQSLSEVVVVGYGTQKKSDVTGAVASVKGEDLEERPSASLNQALAGRVPGANVSVNSGRPGGRANIRIRGNTSVSVTNNPLYVIDGVILNVTDLANGSTPIDYLNPNDIASIEVLKDASATAIYGARGANGVILVTTKRGNQDGGRVNYDTYYSVGVLARKLDLLNSEEFLYVEDVAYQNAEKFDPEGWAAGKYVDPSTKRTNPLLFDASGNPLYDTDWQEEATQDAFTQSHQLSFTGGNEKDSYGAYLGYRNEEGLIKESWLKRYSGRFVFDSQIKDWLKVGGTLSYNDQNEKQIDPLGAGGITTMRQVLEALPIIPVKYPDGSWAGNEDYPGMEGGGNPVNIAEDRIYLLKTQTMLGNLYANIKLAEGLDLRTTLGTNIINQRIDYYGGRTLNYISRNQGGDASVENQRHNSWQFENYLTYNKQISENQSLTGLLGLSWQHVDQFFATARAQRFQDDYFQFNNLGAGANPLAPSSGTTAYGLNSYFGRINYNLQEKYLLTLTGRADGSSKFGSENRYAFFPSAAVAWRASEEAFLQNSSVISNLKLRASYGVTGNSEITAYQSLAGLGNYSLIFNGERTIGVGVNRLANPDLRWEKTHQVDAGLELGLINGKVSIELDVYRKLTSDMLLSAPVPSTSGYTVVTRNIGSMENRGVEFALNTINIASDAFTWSTNFNISVNKNEVKALTGGADIFSGSTVIREGEPVGAFFGYEHLGTWNTDEADEAAQYLRLPGDIKYRDVNNDGQINDGDRVVIGKGIPDGFGSLINTVKYKNLDLTLDLQFMYGNDVLYRSMHSAEDRQGIANSFATVLNAWTPENQNTPIAQWRPIPAGYDTFNDSHRVKDADFIRGRNLLLGYNFAPEFIERLHLNRLRLYASVQNFFVLTEYEGYDPEVSTSGSPFDQGVALYDYPKPRVFMVGLNVGF
ncbi:SusC/RagA family TonB-linked outer membrane protein [Catalinimonas niigatensis]|uniref:SusC/RagA family TonB-linked outer membrane protein n=1 Tax=Catalinimonas niigatensis TaxID=1397264 RepID=UPI002666BC87|nr:SusC/RagA family TonB-linked outer membrane protein [Catalinimonas niigatensis]WPP51728.1 SusC/RagA family TonB-linked outer membrane protein [Catalinimonas niigatensis]